MRMIDTGIFILRISVGVMLLLHGISKLFNGIGFIVSTLQEHGLPGFLGYGVYIGEVVGPLLVIAGFRTKIGGLLIVANMLVAIVMMHAGQIASLGDSGGWAIEKPALFLFAGLALVFTGGGKFSLSSSSRWD